MLETPWTTASETCLFSVPPPDPEDFVPVEEEVTERLLQQVLNEQTV
jgi:hypothetical protein